MYLLVNWKCAIQILIPEYMEVVRVSSMILLLKHLSLICLTQRQSELVK